MPAKPPKFDRVKALETLCDDLLRRVSELEDYEAASNTGFEILANLTGVIDEFKEELRDRIKEADGE